MVSCTGVMESKRQQLETLTSSSSSSSSTSLPTLPYDLVADIFSRLPVKLLVQFRCLSKSFNSLISDSDFAKEHLKSAPNRHHLLLCARELLLFDSPISSLFSTLTQLNYPITPNYVRDRPPFRFSSCHGILCFSIDKSSAVLWNPSIRKFKLLPPLKSSKNWFSMFTFGYHPLCDYYKTVRISFCINKHFEVHVNIMGTDDWKRIQSFPCLGRIFGAGVFVSGTVYWLAHAYGSSLCVIVSLDLENYSYQQFYMPHLNKDLKKLKCSMGEVRDCLCISEWNDTFVNVWIMKDYENKESWTKLYNIPFIEDHHLYTLLAVLHISEDDQLLMKFFDWESKKLKFIIYDSKNGTWKIPEIQNTNHFKDSKVYVESLISPCTRLM